MAGRRAGHLLFRARGRIPGPICQTAFGVCVFAPRASRPAPTFPPSRSLRAN